MPWFSCPRQAAGGVLALEANWFVRASSVFDGCRRVLVDSHDPLSMFEAMVDIVFWPSHVRTGGVESGASIYMWVLPLCALVRVPPVDTLDSSPRVSTRALALE